MEGRRVASGFRVTREWADGSSESLQSDKLSNWTTGPVHTDRTDTPNLVGAPRSFVRLGDWTEHDVRIGPPTHRKKQGKERWTF
jgi:hypothetical protein